MAAFITTAARTSDPTGQRNVPMRVISRMIFRCFPEFISISVAFSIYPEAFPVIIHDDQYIFHLV
jgi:hypothetical protein